MSLDFGIRDLARVLQVSGDVTRLRLLNLFCNISELCVYDLVAIIGESQPKVSRHLAYMRRVGLIENRKDGLWVYYRIAESPRPAVRAVIEALRQSLGLMEDLEADLHLLQRLRDKAPPIRFTRRSWSTGTSLPSQSTAPVAEPTESERYRGNETTLEVELL